MTQNTGGFAVGVPPRELFLDGSNASHLALRTIVTQLLDTLQAADTRTPFPAVAPEELAADVAAIDPLPVDGVPLAEVLAEVGHSVLARGVGTTHPRCAAHLHAPTLLTAAATELAIGASNQSMDSFDQAPAATYVEDHLVRHLAALLGLPPTGTGVLTSGGTASNLLGLLLARHRASDSVEVAGLPTEASRWRIVASAGAHTSVRQAAAVLGLGRDAVAPVSTDDAGRMDIGSLDKTLATLRSHDHKVIAIVGTAGTTDAGAVDPLDVLAERAATSNAWFHVDAAIGSAFALSDRLRPLLSGLEHADSITADLHKLWWQPIGASVLLVRDAAAWHGWREPTDYLNRTDDDDVLNLVDRSLDTSRRFDALKILVSLRTTGRRQLGEMIDHLVELATHAGQLVQVRDELELLAPPQTVTVLFRCHPNGLPDHELDTHNAAVQRYLLTAGQAVIGRTRYRGQVALKLTFVNPLISADDIAELLDLIAHVSSKRGDQP